MEREYLDDTIRHLKCIPFGTKEACIKVREYLKNARLDSGNDMIQGGEYNSVDSKEFVEAVKVLMANSWEQRENDRVPDMWYCDSDCSNIDTCIFCPGECQLAPTDEGGKSLSKRLCPYFSDSGNI